MKYYIFPGSFKPPHKGHVKVLMDIIKKQKDNNYKIIIIISKKSRKLQNKENKVITASQSLKIFKIYINELNKKYKLKGNISAIISKKSSPLLDIYSVLKKTKESNKVFLIKSNKDKNNKRFDMFYRIKKINLLSIKGIKDIHSTNFRKYINNKNKEKINEYILENISKTNRTNIYKILKIK